MITYLRAPRRCLRSRWDRNPNSNFLPEHFPKKRSLKLTSSRLQAEGAKPPRRRVPCRFLSPTHRIQQKGYNESCKANPTTPHLPLSFLRQVKLILTRPKLPSSLHPPRNRRTGFDTQCKQLLVVQEVNIAWGMTGFHNLPLSLRLRTSPQSLVVAGFLARRPCDLRTWFPGPSRV
jgi:hypothetical protein